MKTKENGFTLIELMLVVAIGMVLATIAIQDNQISFENSRADRAGSEMAIYRSAVEAYITDNYMTLVTNPNFTITTAQLVAGNYLPVGYPGTNVFGSTYNTYGTVSGAYPFYVLEALTVSTSPWTMPGPSGPVVRIDWLGEAAKQVGPDGGYTTSATVASGTNAQWTMTHANYTNITAMGQLCARSGYNSSNKAQFYRRDGQLPLTGNMDAGGQELLNIQRAQAGYVDLTTIEAEGTPCGDPGRLARDASGNVIYCDGSSWKQFGVMAGTIAMWPLPVTPQGWLECNGQAVSRITYNTLFANIGVTYGAGNGATTFNLPDYRGVFLRGWDNGAGIDPDAAIRTDRGDGMTGDNVGTRQMDQFRSHQHTLYMHNGPFPPAWAHAPNDSHHVNSQGITDATGGAETRPINVYIMYIIKT